MPALVCTSSLGLFPVRLQLIPHTCPPCPCPTPLPPPASHACSDELGGQHGGPAGYRALLLGQAEGDRRGQEGKGSRRCGRQQRLEGKSPPRRLRAAAAVLTHTGSYRCLDPLSGPVHSLAASPLTSLTDLTRHHSQVDSSRVPAPPLFCCFCAGSLAALASQNPML